MSLCGKDMHEADLGLLLDEVISFSQFLAPLRASTPCVFGAHHVDGKCPSIFFVPCVCIASTCVPVPVISPLFCFSD